jgi:hypothetical protein
MAWTAPYTAIAGSTFTADIFNTYIRDNLNVTEAALALTPGGYFACTGANTIAERSGGTASVLTSETTTSTTYTDLATPGPEVIATTGTTALVIVHGVVQNSGTGSARMSFTVNGVALSTGVGDPRSIAIVNITAGSFLVSGASIETGLTPGSNTFTAKYRVSASTGTFLSRRIIVMPF